MAVQSPTRVRVLRGYYDERDQIGHFVKPPNAAGRPCPHRCCRNYRVHPEHLPIRLDRAYLRTLSSDDLERELDQYANYADTHEAGFLQVIAEMTRREESEKRGAARKERARERRQGAESEYTDEVYRQWLRAEAETKGVMLNKAGLAAGYQRAIVVHRARVAGQQVRESRAD